jgi:EmrB/QacA subfamily drug resistance transporter
MFALILGPAGGPILGGFLIEQLSWRWAFYVNIPVGFAALLFGAFFLHEHREEGAGAFDIPGFLLAGTGIALVMYALSEGPVHGWGSASIIAPGLIGAVVLAIFVMVELRVAAPMVQLRLLGNRLFRSTLFVSFFATGGFLGVLFLTPLFLQEARGASPLDSGLTTFPEALGVVVSTQIVARLYPRFGPRRLMAGGLAWVAIDVVLLCTFGLSGDPWVVRLLMFGLGVGMAYVFLPNQAASLATISSADTGRASTLSSVQRQLGSATGVALLSSVLAGFGPITTTALGTTEPNLFAYRAAFLAAAALSLTGAALALRVPDADAAATMRPTGRPIPATRREIAAAVPEGD